MKINILALLLVPFCLDAQNSTVTRTLASFDKIAISGGYDAVILKEGDTESITLEVSGIDPDKIETKVERGTLEIGMKHGAYKNFKARLTVTYRNIKGLVNSGSTDVEVLSTIKGDAFELESSGSGNFRAAFDVQKLEIAISGSSDMKLSGKAVAQDISISGSGDVNAGGLQGSEAKVAISGSGDVSLGVTGKVRTSVSGSGTVTNN